MTGVQSFRFWLKKITVVLVCCVCFFYAGTTTLLAKTWQVDEVPIPRLTDVRRYVSNPEGILSAVAVDSLDRMLFALEKDKGVQVLIVVLDKIAGSDAYDFSMRIARKYGVGSAKRHTGLVVLLAKGNRQYQFLTGRGLEGTLPDAIIQRVEDKWFVPHLKKGEVDAAFLQAMKAIDGFCRGDKTLLPEEKSKQQRPLTLALIAILFFVYYVLLGGGNNDGKGGRGGKLNDLFLLGALLGARSRNSGFGSGFGGGSYGGGSFGGGGSGGRF